MKILSDQPPPMDRADVADRPQLAVVHGLHCAPREDLVGRIIPLPLFACIRIVGGDPAPDCARRAALSDGPEAA